MPKFTYGTILLACSFLLNTLSAHGQKLKTAVEINNNYKTFSAVKREVTAEWAAKNPEFKSHPDAGFARGETSKDLIELFGKRTKESKFFIKQSDSHAFVLQQSLKDMHYLSKGQWLEIDPRLMPLNNGVIEAPRQVNPVGFDVNRKAAYINTNQGKVYFNNWSLSGVRNQVTATLASASWTNYTAGDDGIFIKDIFSGIDAEMQVSNGSVKTNFIVRQNNFPGYDQLQFSDAFSDPSNGALAFTVGSASNNRVGDVDYRVGGRAVLRIEKAIAYPKTAGATNQLIALKYSIDKNKLGVLVDERYLDQQLLTGPVIIDPRVSSTLTLTSADGGKNCGSFANSCQYNLAALPPPGSTIKKVYNRFTIAVTSPVNNGNAAFGVSVNGGCGYAYGPIAGSTSTAGFGTADSTRNGLIGYDSVTSVVLPCIPAGACPAVAINFTLRMWDTYCGGDTLCNNLYMRAAENFVVILEGVNFAAQPITRSSNTTICAGASITLSRLGLNGAAPYTYSWLPTGDTTRTITVSPSVTTRYTSIVTDACGVSYTDTTTVVVANANTLPSFTNPIRLCQFDAPLSLATRVTGTSLKWYATPTGGVASNVAPVPSTSVPGTYNYYVTQNSICGESPRAQVTVVVTAKPAPPGVTTPLHLCQYDTVALTANGQNIRWYLDPVGGGGQSPFSPPTGGVNDSTYYYATQTVNGCESDRSRLLVTVTYKPNGIITPTRIALCQSELDTFFYYGNARPDAVYNWTSPHPATTEVSGAGTQGPYVVRFDSAGTYNVNVQVNNRGCLSDIASQPVVVRPSPSLDFVSPDDVCVNSIVNIALTAISPRIDSFTYNFAGGTIKYGASSGGPYGVVFGTAGTVVISNTAYSRGCPSRVTLDTIIVHPLPDARFTVTPAGGGNVICNGDSVVLSAREQDSNTHFVWKPDNFYPSGNVYTSKGYLLKSGYVSLMLTSAYGCSASDSIYVRTESCCQVFFPNAFSPNGDGKNDVFRPVSRGHHEVKTFRVVNRWGQVVYESQDERKGWDGSYNGKAQDAGTYYYYLSYGCGEGIGETNRAQLEEKGEVILIR